MVDAFVLLHGYTGSPASWDEVRASLAEARRVLCPAIVGHAADTSPALDFVTEVDRLARAIEAAGCANSHLCGYSLGARLALGLLVRHPHLFARATLVGANPGLPEHGPDRAERVAADERWAVLAESRGSTHFGEQWSAQPLFASQRALRPEAAAKQDAVRAGHDGAALAAAMRALSLGRMPDWRTFLGSIKVPVRLMAGGLDQKFVRLAYQMAGQIPDSSVTIVPDVGHNILLECPSAIVAALREN